MNLIVSSIFGNFMEHFLFQLLMCLVVITWFGWLDLVLKLELKSCLKPNLELDHNWTWGFLGFKKLEPDPF
jgi:hypothetical protein